MAVDRSTTIAASVAGIAALFSVAGYFLRPTDDKLNDLRASVREQGNRLATLSEKASSLETDRANMQGRLDGLEKLVSAKIDCVRQVIESQRK